MNKLLYDYIDKDITDYVIIDYLTPSNSIVLNSTGVPENPSAINTITINATATAINGANINSLYIAPIRGVATGRNMAYVMMYDPVLKEVYYSTN